MHDYAFSKHYNPFLHCLYFYIITIHCDDSILHYKQEIPYEDQIFLRSNDAELSMLVSWSCVENATVADLDLSATTYDNKGVLMENIDFNNLLASDKSIELKGDSIQSVLGAQTNEGKVYRYMKTFYEYFITPNDKRMLSICLI